MVLRQLERWLHQHIFKVGWLVTKDYQTTTILYYTFLLPGVLLHELIYWLSAGLLNVRADRQIAWPKAQQIGKLDLNFVKLPKNVHPLKLAVINATPLLVGVACIWFISNNIFRVPDVLITAESGSLDSVIAALRQLVQVSDFWLWFYFSFTVANTMLPDLKHFGGIRGVGIIAGIVTAVFTAIGVGDEIIVGVVGGPVASALNVLASTFAVVIAINIVAIGVLAAIENTIELITGDSADFRDGKMITMTREERISQRMKEIERQRKARERSRTEQAVPAGPPSVYKLPLPLPGSPGEVQVTALQTVITDEKLAPPQIARPERAGAALISGKLEGDEGRRLGSTLTKPQLPNSTAADDEERDETDEEESESQV